MDKFVATETLIIILLLIVSLVAIAVRRLRVPYTVALVIAGLLITFQQSVEISLTPELILSLFVPPLIFEAAFHIEYRKLREQMLAILVLAVPGVLLTTVLVGLITSFGVGISLSSALVFGALIAATDPVAIVALFRALGAPKSLTVLLEGESLFNDGTAIVVFNLMLVAALPALPVAVASTTIDATTSSDAARGLFFLFTATIDFVRVSAGGIGVGLGAGWLISQLIARVDDYLIETTLTTVLAFGTYLLAERLHVSGVLAVVAAGIVCGNVGLRNMSPTTRIVLLNFWEYLAFVVNSLVFLLIGLDVNVLQIVAYARPIAIAVLAIIVSRALVVYGLAWLVNRGKRKVQSSYQHVLFWGGLRGAIGLALVLSLPPAFADRELLRVMTFGVVLFTLLVQGTTMQLLLSRLHLTRREGAELEYERRHARLMTARAALDRLQQLHTDGSISATAWQRLAPELGAEIQASMDAHEALLREQPMLRAEELGDARREGLRARRAMLGTLLSDGVISEQVYGELLAEVDAKLQGNTSIDVDE